MHTLLFSIVNKVSLWCAVWTQGEYESPVVAYAFPFDGSNFWDKQT